MSAPESDVLPRPDHLDASDRALVARCADGDVAALHSLYGRHGATVWGCAQVAARRAGTPAADDLATAAFVALWDQARAVLTGSRTIESALVVAVARLGLGRPAFA